MPYFGVLNQSMQEGAFQNKLEIFTGTAQYDFKEIKPFFVPKYFICKWNTHQLMSSKEI